MNSCICLRFAYRNHSNIVRHVLFPCFLGNNDIMEHASGKRAHTAYFTQSTSENRWLPVFSLDDILPHYLSIIIFYEFVTKQQQFRGCARYIFYDDNFCTFNIYLHMRVSPVTVVTTSFVTKPLQKVRSDIRFQSVLCTMAWLYDRNLKLQLLSCCCCCCCCICSKKYTQMNTKPH